MDKIIETYTGVIGRCAIKWANKLKEDNANFKDKNENEIENENEISDNIK